MRNGGACSEDRQFRQPPEWTPPPLSGYIVHPKDGFTVELMHAHSGAMDTPLYSRRGSTDLE